MIVRLEPLQSGRDTEIDMIEREMEGGVVIIQPPDVSEDDVEEQVPTPWVASRGRGPARRAPYST